MDINKNTFLESVGIFFFCNSDFKNKIKEIIAEVIRNLLGQYNNKPYFKEDLF